MKKKSAKEMAGIYKDRRLEDEENVKIPLEKGGEIWFN